MHLFQEEVMKKVKPRVHDANDFQWFAEFADKEEELDDQDV